LLSLFIKSIEIQVISTNNPIYYIKMDYKSKFST